MDDILALKELFPRVTQVRLAADFNVTVGTLRAWLADALRRRANTRIVREVKNGVAFSQ